MSTIKATKAGDSLVGTLAKPRKLPPDLKNRLRSGNVSNEPKGKPQSDK